MRDLRAFAWSMSQLPGMPALPPRGRRICVSCGGGTYKGSSTCMKCEKSQASLSRRLARASRVQPQPRAPVACWICGKLMISHGAERPACKECRQKYGAGVCSKCGGPKRATKPGMCRGCYGRSSWVAEPTVCELCECMYVPKYRPRPGKQQRWCSKSCAQAWRNGARPPYARVADGDYKSRKLSMNRRRLRVRAETWDGVTNEAIMEGDRWRCGIRGNRIGKSFKYPHPRSKSVDHVMPLSQGGDDTAANKRPAHLGCTNGRMKPGRGQQLAMIG